MVGILAQIDRSLAHAVAANLGLEIKTPEEPVNHSIPADGDPKKFQPLKRKSSLQESAALSMAGTIKNSIRTRKVAILTADGADEMSIVEMKRALENAGAVAHIIGPRLGFIQTNKKAKISIDQSLLTSSSVLYDAVYVAGGDEAASLLKNEPDAVHFLNEAFKHCKAIAAHPTAMPVIAATYFASATTDKERDEGVIIHSDIKKLATGFIKAIANHRFWDRETERKVPA